MLHGSVMLLAEGASDEKVVAVPAWVIGGGMFLLLALLLFIVTRINIDR